MVDMRLEWLSVIVERHPGWRHVLEDYGITGRHGVDVTLAAAAELAGADIGEVIAALSGGPRHHADCASLGRAPVPTVIDHILRVHHDRLWRELSTIADAIDRARRHGAGCDQLDLLEDRFTRFRLEMEPHLRAEEELLFPLCRDVAAAFSWPSFYTGPIGPALEVVRHDHDHAGDLIDELADAADQLTRALDLPESDPPLVSLGAAVEELIADLRQHLVEEIEVLIPATLRLADELAVS